MIELASSILSANFACLGAEAQAAVEGGATVLHVDIMDGHFVPNLTIGPPVGASLRKVSRVPLDCHFMIEHPDEFIPMFAEAGVDWISVHQEACTHLDRTLHLIASHGCKPGVVINPATPIHVLDEVLPLVHHVLVMSVNPGFGGQTFIHSSLRKLSCFRESGSLAAWSFALRWTAASTTTPWRTSCAPVLRSWSQAALYSSRATREKTPGNCWNPSARPQTRLVRISRLSWQADLPIMAVSV